MAEKSVAPRAPPPLPIQCVFCPDLKLFQVTMCRGKGLSSGGFGVVLNKSKEDDNNTNRMVDVENGKEEGRRMGESAESSNTAGDSRDEASTKSVGQEYLFIEEVIFLYEQGKLEVVWDGKEGSHHESSSTTASSSYRLYSLLEPCGVSLAAYLVYAHLRSQNFRVLRHTSTRRKILETMEEVRELWQENQQDGRSDVGGEPDAEQKFDIKASDHLGGNINEVESDSSESNTEPTTTNQMSQLILELREDAAKASPPTVYQGNSTSATRSLFMVSSTATIAFDVYLPNTHFSRRFPGLPDLYVAATFYHAARLESLPPPSLTFNQLQDLLRFSGGIPLRIATVSDAGTVVMFRVTDFGVPEIQRT